MLNFWDLPFDVIWNHSVQVSNFLNSAKFNLINANNWHFFIIILMFNMLLFTSEGDSFGIVQD